MKRQFLPIIYFFIFAVVSGSIYSQCITVLGVSAMELFGASSRQVASLYLMIALCSITVTLGFGYLSDQHGHRWLLICVALICGAVATIMATKISSYSELLYIFAPLFSVVYLCTPQLMAIYRSLLDEIPSSKNIAFYNAVVRSGFALAWIIGPPIGYVLKEACGVDGLFRILSASYAAALVYALLGMKWIKGGKSRTKGLMSTILSSATVKSETEHASKIIVLFGAFSLGYSVNHGYLINLPVYLQSKIPEQIVLAGVVFGVAAATEIPFMILSGWLTKKIGAHFLVLIGIVSGVLLCLLTPVIVSQWWLICVQLFNGVFVGFLAGLGLTVFQDADKGRLGLMSSLYSVTMTLGQIIASVILFVNSHFFGADAGFLFLAFSGTLSALTFWIYIRTSIKPRVERAARM